MLVQLSGYDPNIVLDSGYPASIVSTFVYNLQTGEKLSLEALFSARVSTFLPIRWDSSGQFLMLSTDAEPGRTEIVHFTNSAGSWTLQVVGGMATPDHVAIDWLGVDDLLVTNTGEPDNKDYIYHISQIINGSWYSTEFLRLPDAMFDEIGERDWYFAPSEEEKHALSCLFDQALATRLASGTRARVNFTDGTPLRLRAAPSFDAAVLTQMPEGTAFDVLGGPACVNGEDYTRFWQLALDDGTVGWAAEADTTSTFIEPVPDASSG